MQAYLSGLLHADIERERLRRMTEKRSLYFYLQVSVMEGMSKNDPTDVSVSRSFQGFRPVPSQAE